MSDVGTGAAIFGCAGTVLLPDEIAFFRDFDPFGFILFARNIESPEQVRRLTEQLRAAVGRDAVITVDQEGGRVQRLRHPYWREWEPAFDMVRHAGPQAERAMVLRSRIIAKELRAVGIDSNCAPVADIATATTHPFLRNRCYGTDATQVARLARAAAVGHLAEGVLPVVKHMPGHGRSMADTHHDLPRVAESAETLIATDFAPFAALADLPMAMTAHIIYESFDADNPATQSAEMIRQIRQGIGFAGLLMTDDLNMQALVGSLAQRASRSIAAGCDIALHCKGELDQMIEVASAAGPMTEAARLRAGRALAQRVGVSSDDILALDAEFGEVMAAGEHVRTTG